MITLNCRNELAYFQKETSFVLSSSTALKINPSCNTISPNIWRSRLLFILLTFNLTYSYKTLSCYILSAPACIWHLRTVRYGHLTTSLLKYWTEHFLKEIPLSILLNATHSQFFSEIFTTIIYIFWLNNSTSNHPTKYQPLIFSLRIRGKKSEFIT